MHIIMSILNEMRLLAIPIYQLGYKPQKSCRDGIIPYSMRI